LGGSPLARTYEAVYASILENRELQSSNSERSTRHIEISLPEGASYVRARGDPPRRLTNCRLKVLRSFS
ncbi:hypothetical protein ACT453_62365, partial [Bacillus sp. D-CC]